MKIELLLHANLPDVPTIFNLCTCPKYNGIIDESDFDDERIMVPAGFGIVAEIW